MLGDASMEMRQEKSGPELVTERAKVLCSEALDADNEGKSEEAVNLYAEAVELCLKAVCIGFLFAYWIKN